MFFNDRDFALIRQIPLSIRMVKDVLTWPYDSKGSYTVKSGHRLINGELISQSKAFWKQLWKLIVPCKLVRNFIWRCTTDCLPIVDRLHQKKVHVHVDCLPKFVILRVRLLLIYFLNVQ